MHFANEIIEKGGQYRDSTWLLYLTLNSIKEFKKNEFHSRGWDPEKR